MFLELGNAGVYALGRAIWFIIYVKLACLQILVYQFLVSALLPDALPMYFCNDDHFINCIHYIDYEASNTLGLINNKLSTRGLFSRLDKRNQDGNQTEMATLFVNYFAIHSH